jgi:hypothetical protein
VIDKANRAVPVPQLSQQDAVRRPTIFGALTPPSGEAVLRYYDRRRAAGHCWQVIQRIEMRLKSFVPSHWCR